MSPWLVLLVFVSSNLAQIQIQPEMRIPQGNLRGIRQRSQSGNEMISFFGIPYAIPPLGKMRFKPPVKHPGWTGTLDATQYRDACAQFDSSGEIFGSEDCLFLNVFARAQPSASASLFNNLPVPPYMNGEQFPMNPFENNLNPPLLPVLVYFHAESFESGDASLYGPEILLDKEIILVTLNYRLGIFGYLSTEDEQAPGNLALHDQRLALIWIQKNIRYFGGDASRVTIAGQGAGAANVFDHLLSRWSSGLFHAAILQSGSGLCGWAREREPVTFAKKVANHVGCHGHPDTMKYNHSKIQKSHLPASIQDKIRTLNQREDYDFASSSPSQGVLTNRNNDLQSNSFNSKQLVDCLRQTSTDILLKAQTAFKIFGEFPQRAAPIVEEHPNGFLIDEPINLLKRSIVNKVPVILGWNTHEGAYFYSLIKALDFSANLEYYQKVIVPKFIEATMYLNNKISKTIIQRIVNEYFPSSLNANETELSLQFIKMASDGMYGWCMESTAQALGAAGLPVHVYQYDYRGSNSMLDLLLRLQHENGVAVQHNMRNNLADIASVAGASSPAATTPVLPWPMQRLVCHGDELFSLYQLHIAGLRAPNQSDRLVSVQLTSMWAEFMSMRNQSWLFNLNRGLWPTFQSKRQIMLIQQTPKVVVWPTQPAWEFWKQLHLIAQINSTAASAQQNSSYLPVLNPKRFSPPNSDQITFKNSSKYATLAFVMIGVSASLLFLVIILLLVLWYTKRSQSFCATITDTIRSTGLY